jgi:hypothetical protein
MDTKDIRIKAVVVGVLIDIVGSILLGVALGILVVAINGTTTSAENLAALNDNVYVDLFGLLGSIFCTALGGYVAARMTLPDGFINSLAVGVLSVVLGIILVLLVPGITPAWKILVGVLLTIPAALVGGKIATRASV